MFRTLTKSVAGFLVTAALVASAPAVSAAGQYLVLHFVDRVNAFDTDGWTHYVRAGYHRLEVEGDGDTDLDCVVVDQFGNTLGSDRDATDYCIVTWYQTTDRQVSFRIENLGRVYNRYEFRLW
jgi:hypothetical protein